MSYITHIDEYKEAFGVDLGIERLIKGIDAWINTYHNPMYYFEINRHTDYKQVAMMWLKQWSAAYSIQDGWRNYKLRRWIENRIRRKHMKLILNGEEAAAVMFHPDRLAWFLADEDKRRFGMSIAYTVEHGPVRNDDDSMLVGENYIKSWC